MNIFKIFIFLFVNSISFLQIAFGQIERGNELFDLNCARCHGGDANGGEYGPSIVAAYSSMTDEILENYLRTGNPSSGMPAVNIEIDDLLLVIGYLRSIAPLGAFNPDFLAERRTILLDNEETLTGVILGEGFIDLQIRDDEGQIHLLRKLNSTSEAIIYKKVTSNTNWPSYNGTTLGYRHTELTEINKNNVGQLSAAWSFNLDVPGMVQTTPIVQDGIMYVTHRNAVWALDAGSGRQLWKWSRPFTEGLTGNATLGANRGVTISGNLLFFLTDNAHMVALNKNDGTIFWETTLADWNDNYNSTNAPLVFNDLVIGGHAGGDEGVRGFIAAYNQLTGVEEWRFWTIPSWGETGSETWPNPESIEHGGGATWMTGSFDPELNILYWPVGNPGPDLFGDNREGDNLYTDSVLALDANTGKLLWHYQFTPHDIHDWDAQEPLALIDSDWNGTSRKLLVQANRNGFFYVLDRITGELLLAKPFLNNVNWASGVDETGRPILQELSITETGESYVCPGLVGGTNWHSTGYISETGIYYIQALEECNLFSERDQEWRRGQSYLGGVARRVPGEDRNRYLRGIDIHTGEIVLEIPQGPSSSNTFPGVLTTSTGLVIFDEHSGSIVAADANTGEVLWQFNANVQSWRGSPMAYDFDGNQYIAVAAGENIIAFSLPK
jgi:alcohol dehydrogenase (cytochrome c)